MRIEAVDAYVLTVPLPTPWRIGTATMETASAVIVRVGTDAGIWGTGECLARLGAHATAAIVREVLAPVILQRDPLEIEAIWHAMVNVMRHRGHMRGYFMEAVSGVDIALWDIAGRALELPVYRVLFGVGRTTIPCYASSIFLSTPDEAVNQGRAIVARGFKAIKLKIGRGVEADVEVVAALRDGLGPHVAIMVDANGRYSLAEARRLARDFEQLGVHWFEEPLPADDIDGYAELRRTCRLMLAAGEAEFTAQGARALIERRLVDIIQPDVARAGGVTGCRKIANLAEAHNVAYQPHTGASSAVCIAASLHLAAALPNVTIYEHMVAEQPLQKIVHPDLPIPVNGQITLPEGSGLGVTLLPEVLERLGGD